jgi:hypothetical protein
MTGAAGAELPTQRVSDSHMVSKPFSFDAVVLALLKLVGRAD